MAKSRTPDVDLTDERLLAMVELLEQMVDARCPDSDDFDAMSQASMEVGTELQWLAEHRRLEGACTTAEVITVGGEPYRKLSQPSARTYHGLWGAHRIEEPLYRRMGVRNGPTLKPLDVRLGVIKGVVLPALARAAGAMMATMTSRQTERHLQRLGFRPPSRAVLEKRIVGMFDDMAVVARELEDHCREVETLDFELSAISCGLDRFAVHMDETLPDGPERDQQLEQRRPADEYQRTPPEPYKRRWRMAWAGNVTLYDPAGRPRHSFRYGTSADGDATALAARMVDDIESLTRAHQGVTVGHLRRELAGHREHQDAEDDEDDVCARLREALTYFDKRRSQMAYSRARAANLPVASGATESTCSLFQLRVKHPGSHWGTRGLRGVMTARGLDLSDRWDNAFHAHRTTLHEQILAA